MQKILMFLGLTLLLMLGNSNQVIFAQRGGRAQEVIEVRVGSPLPQNSPWGRSLDRVAAEWNRITNGQVRLNIRHGGIEGSETRMQMSLASNTIQAAVFTSIGLNEYNPSILTLSAPFLIRTYDELNAVMNEVQGDLEAGINSGDYFIISWSRAGFVNVFSRDPVFTPDDLRRQRIASNPETEDMNTAFKTMGFQVVDSDFVDIGQRLATGQIQAIYNNPAAVAAFQLNTYLRNMLSINLAPVIGGIVINQVTWRRIGALDPTYQQSLIRVTRQLTEELDRSMQRTVNDAINAMARGGLVVNRPNQSQEQLWYNEIERTTPALLGSIYDRALYQRINNILTRFRSSR